MSRCTLVCNVLHCTPVCKHGAMAPDSSRARSTAETRDRILDVALEVLGANPDAGMGEIATAAALSDERSTATSPPGSNSSGRSPDAP